MFQSIWIRKYLGSKYYNIFPTGHFQAFIILYVYGAVFRWLFAKLITTTKSIKSFDKLPQKCAKHNY